MTNIRSSDIEQIDETICLYKFTGVFHSYTYFNLINKDNSTDNTIIVIRSAWLITYQNKLSDDLAKVENVNMISAEDIKKLETNNCDWVAKAHYKEYGVFKGAVFSNIQNNNTDRIKKAVSIATNTLDDNYPFLEITLLSIGSIIAFVVVCIILNYIKHGSNGDRGFSFSSV